MLVENTYEKKDRSTISRGVSLSLLYRAVGSQIATLKMKSVNTVHLARGLSLSLLSLYPCGFREEEVCPVWVIESNKESGLYVLRFSRFWIDMDPLF